jgi:hypothetical protein
LKQIERFKNTYKLNNAIYWYTPEMFLYHLVNQILRTPKNLNNVFKIRLFLTDLMIGLKMAQLDFLYCGKVLRRSQEIEDLRSAVGNSIIFNQFLSTTLNR